MNRKEAIEYKYHGARALVMLHEQALRGFIETWKTIKDNKIPLPATKDSNYTSYQTLLRHVIWWAREYMLWICKNLEFPSPPFKPVPTPETIEAELPEYVDHLLEEWGLPLAEVPERRFFEPLYTSRWLVDYCIEAMLEHAVMHPTRHRFQLLELLQMHRQTNS